LDNISSTKLTIGLTCSTNSTSNKLFRKTEFYYYMWI